MWAGLHYHLDAGLRKDLLPTSLWLLAEFVAVEFMAAFFLKARNRETVSLLLEVSDFRESIGPLLKGL